MGPKSRQARNGLESSIVTIARWGALAAVAAGLVNAPLGCGPSVQYIYEGNLRFEHCYRLDLDPSIAPSHREACWREWLQSYTSGQTSDRVDYAKRRERALAAGDSSPIVLEVTHPQGMGPIQAPEAPIPSSVHATPIPKLKDSAPAPSASSPKPAPDPPGTDCLTECQARFRVCRVECDAAASSPGKNPRGRQAANAGPAPAAGCDRCDRDFRGCVRTCATE